MKHTLNEISDTHTACRARINEKGAKAECCGCNPHKGCSLKRDQSERTGKDWVSRSWLEIIEDWKK